MANTNFLISCFIAFGYNQLTNNNVTNGWTKLKF